ncbi:helix-turn-helix domain-containing protein [Falsiroseomonas sp. HW251]|uniref:helix-turn-helix domain-containing protein n=1 Tax=Falsiroseomonas sp. HW251 TaxID=3390998 RepID=UPI003D310F10
MPCWCRAGRRCAGAGRVRPRPWCSASTRPGGRRNRTSRTGTSLPPPADCWRRPRRARGRCWRTGWRCGCWNGWRARRLPPAATARSTSGGCASSPRSWPTPRPAWAWRTSPPPSGSAPRIFARAFRARTGVPPHGWAASLRLARALDALRQPGRSLAEIALEVGFAYQAHMTREVRRATGLTPGALRR